MVARIYRPAKTVVQSGLGRTKHWNLEFISDTPRQAEPLMGWMSTTDTQEQVRLTFDTKEEAIAYAERQGIEYRVIEPKESKSRKVAYSDNFRYGRMGPWSH